MHRAIIDSTNTGYFGAFADNSSVRSYNDTGWHSAETETLGLTGYSPDINYASASILDGRYTTNELYANVYNTGIAGWTVTSTESIAEWQDDDGWYGYSSGSEVSEMLGATATLSEPGTLYLSAIDLKTNWGYVSDVKSLELSIRSDTEYTDVGFSTQTIDSFVVTETPWYVEFVQTDTKVDMVTLSTYGDGDVAVNASGVGDWGNELIDFDIDLDPDGGFSDLYVAHTTETAIIDTLGANGSWSTQVVAREFLDIFASFEEGGSVSIEVSDEYDWGMLPPPPPPLPDADVLLA
jgi:hypothetical protein